jgi:hypothetical protein
MELAKLVQGLLLLDQMTNDELHAAVKAIFAATGLDGWALMAPVNAADMLGDNMTTKNRSKKVLTVISNEGGVSSAQFNWYGSLMHTSIDGTED